MTINRSTSITEFQKKHRNMIDKYVQSVIQKARTQDPGVRLEFDDVYQDSLIHFWRVLDPSRMEQCKRYFYRIIWSAARDQVRKNSRFPETSLDENPAEETPDHQTENLERKLSRKAYLDELRRVLREHPIHSKEHHLSLAHVLDLELNDTPRQQMKEILNCVDSSLHNYRQRIYKTGRSLAEKMDLTYSDV